MGVAIAQTVTNNTALGLEGDCQLRLGTTLRGVNKPKHLYITDIPGGEGEVSLLNREKGYEISLSQKKAKGGGEAAI